MDNDNKQNLFLEELRTIQEYAINTIIRENYSNDEDFVRDITYDTIYSVIELIDGYGRRGMKFELKDSDGNIIIDARHNLHDRCEDYLLYAKKYAEDK